MVATTGAASQRAAGIQMIGSGLTSLISTAASLKNASIQAKQFKLQGAFNELAASQEKLRAREQSVFLRKKFLQNISSANASFAARGVSTGSGIGRQFAIQSLRNLSEDIQATELNSQAAQNSLTLRATQARLAGKTVRNISLLTAAGTGSKGAQSLLTGFKTLKEANQRIKQEGSNA